MGFVHYQHEIELLYSQTLAKGYRSLAVCSVLAGDGATTILSALAQRNVLAGNSTLVVDLNIANPGFAKEFDLPDANNPFDAEENNERTLIPGLVAPQLVSINPGGAVFNGIYSPEEKSCLLKLSQPELLQRQIQVWLQRYDTVLVDTSALIVPHSHTVPAQQVASACEACLLVVLSGFCTQAQIKSAMECLEQQQVNLIGTVMNDHYHPRLVDELKRELNRIHRLVPRFVRWAKSRLDGVALLSMDV